MYELNLSISLKICMGIKSGESNLDAICTSFCRVLVKDWSNRWLYTLCTPWFLCFLFSILSHLMPNWMNPFKFQFPYSTPPPLVLVMLHCSRFAYSWIIFVLGYNNLDHISSSFIQFKWLACHNHVQSNGCMLTAARYI